MNSRGFFGVHVDNGVTVRPGFRQIAALWGATVNGSGFGPAVDFLAIVLTTQCPVIKTSFGQGVSIGRPVAHRDGVLVGGFGAIAGDVQDATSITTETVDNANGATGTSNRYCFDMIFRK